MWKRRRYVAEEGGRNGDAETGEGLVASSACCFCGFVTESRLRDGVAEGAMEACCSSGVRGEAGLAGVGGRDAECRLTGVGGDA